MNSLQKQEKPKFSVALQSDAYKNLINNTLQDKKVATNFVANISTVVAQNPQLQECSPASIISAGLVAESLKLSMLPSLGFFYLVPFNRNRKDANGNWVSDKVAQAQIGYKGYIQLAIRSGQYAKINVRDVREGEAKVYDPLTDTFEFEWIKNFDERKKAKVVGYIGYFKLVNGFEKYVYFSYDEMLDHADKYSQAFSKVKYQAYLQASEKEKNSKDYSSHWYKSFDDMAYKTVIRRLISRWGIMSIEMQEAYMKDQAAMKADGTYEYVDNPDFDEEFVENGSNFVEETGEVIENVKEVAKPTPKPKTLKSVVKEPTAPVSDEDAETRRKELFNLFGDQLTEEAKNRG